MGAVPQQRQLPTLTYLDHAHESRHQTLTLLRPNAGAKEVVPNLPHAYQSTSSPKSACGPGEVANWTVIQ